MKKLLLLAASFILPLTHVWAGELVYQPQNTAFGGNNASATQVLMSKAQSQDTTENPNKTTTAPQTALERFQASLERRVLDQIAREIVSGAFDTDNSILDDAGTFSTDEFSITVNNDNPDAISISITEFASGSETVMEIPKF